VKFETEGSDIKLVGDNGGGKLDCDGSTPRISVNVSNTAAATRWTEFDFLNEAGAVVFEGKAAGSSTGPGAHEVKPGQAKFVSTMYYVRECKSVRRVRVKFVEKWD
jgi:hypothetical protein